METLRRPEKDESKFEVKMSRLQEDRFLSTDAILGYDDSQSHRANWKKEEERCLCGVPGDDMGKIYITKNSS